VRQLRELKSTLMNIKKITTLLGLAAILFFAGCKDDDDDKTSPNTNPNTAINPTVEATSPADNADDVALNKIVSAGFNQAMDATTFNSTSFTLKQGTSSIAGTVTYAGLTATFEPSAALTDNTTYTATITNAVKNTSGKAIASDVMWTFTTGINATGMNKVNLRSAENFVILAKTAINNSPTSNITGDIGISPAAASFITGFSLVSATGYATSSQITGRAYAADMASPTPTNLTTAVSDMITAYNDAAGRSNADFNELASGNIGGKTLVPGLYKWTNTVIAPKNLVISGSATDIWIFQIAGDLTVSSGVNITLSGGAKAENIFWQVAGEVTIQSTANFKGIILSMTGITLQTAAVFNGRALAQTAVILDANTVTQP
jgi:hypothetical protein